MTDEQIRTLLNGVFLIIWAGGVVSWCFAAYYMLKTMSRFHPERQWGKYIPVSIFMPWFFTTEGNNYRVKMLRATSVFLILVASGIGVGFVIDSLTPSNVTQLGCESSNLPVKAAPCGRSDVLQGARPLP